MFHQLCVCVCVGGGGEMVYGGGGRGRVYTYHLLCHHQNNSCIKMGSDESHFNASLILRDKVTRQCEREAHIIIGISIAMIIMVFTVPGSAVSCKLITDIHRQEPSAADCQYPRSQLSARAARAL